MKTTLYRFVLCVLVSALLAETSYADVYSVWGLLPHAQEQGVKACFEQEALVLLLREFPQSISRRSTAAQFRATSLWGHQGTVRTPRIVERMSPEQVEDMKKSLYEILPEIQPIAEALMDSSVEFYYADTMPSLGYLEIHKGKTNIFLDAVLREKVGAADAKRNLVAFILAEELAHLYLRKTMGGEADVTEEMAILVELSIKMWNRLDRRDIVYEQGALHLLMKDLEPEKQWLLPSLERLETAAMALDRIEAWEFFAEQLRGFPCFSKDPFDREKFNKIREQLRRTMDVSNDGIDLLGAEVQFGGLRPGSRATYPVQLAKALRPSKDAHAHPPLIVDGGTGQGLVAEWLQDHGFHVVGLDRDEGYLKGAIARAVEASRPLVTMKTSGIIETLVGLTEPTLVYTQADLVKGLPFPDNSVDGIVLHRFLSMITSLEDRRHIFKEAYRVLRPGGYISYLDFFRKIPGDPYFGRSGKLYRRDYDVIGILLEQGLVADSLRTLWMHPDYCLRLILENTDSNITKKRDELTAEEVLEGLSSGSLRIAFIALHATMSAVQQLFNDQGFLRIEEIEARIPNRTGSRITTLRGYLAQKPARAEGHSSSNRLKSAA